MPMPKLCLFVHICPYLLHNIWLKVPSKAGLPFAWWALSSISLSIERAPPLSNSLHTIYLVPLLFVFVYCINFSVSIVLIFCNIIIFVV